MLFWRVSRETDDVVPDLHQGGEKLLQFSATSAWRVIYSALGSVTGHLLLYPDKPANQLPGLELP